MASDHERVADVAERPAAPTRPAGLPLRGWLGRAWRVLEYSSAYLALVGAAEVLIVTHLLSLSASLAPLVVAFVTFAVYANDRLVDLESDGASNPRRTAFVRRHRRTLYVLAALAYGAGAALSVLGGPLAFGIALLPGGVWVAYAVDWIGLSAVRFDRLKEVPVVSSVLIATAWSLAVVVLPIAFADGPITPDVGVVFAYFVLATFVNAEVANVRDVESDAENGVETMATLLGVARTRAALYAVALSAGMVLGVAAAGGLLGSFAAAALALGIACLLAVVALVGRADDAPLTVAAECTRLPAFAVLAVAGLL
ncbi:MAG: UbiA family prenyltransferase [Haloferacaceae archaeon]